MNEQQPANPNPPPQQPSEQPVPERAGKNGNVPPKEHRFSFGNKASTNRDTSGIILRNYIDRLTRKGIKEEKLKKIIADPKQKPLLRVAAERVLMCLDRSTIADFQPWLNGEMTMEELEKDGVNIRMVKKAKVRVRTLEDGSTVTEREIELHDRSAEAVKLVCDYTEGKPKQSVNITEEPILRTPADRARCAEEIGERLRKILKGPQ